MPRRADRGGRIRPSVRRINQPLAHTLETRIFVSGVFPADGSLRLVEIGIQAIQLSHITRVPRRVTPDTWA
jgi:hypothetical protein